MSHTETAITHIVEARQLRIDDTRPPCDLRIKKGDIACIVGASECGKSSLLLTLSGVYLPEAGEVTIFGRNPHAVSDVEWMSNRLKVAHVLPSGSLVSHLTVLQNVMLPLSYHLGLPVNQAQEKALWMLDWLGSQTDVGLLPSKLSEYERRIVNLARALILEPDILFIDEAFANFDQAIKNRFIEKYRTINQEKNITLVLASDDLQPAGRCAQQFIFMADTDILSFTSWQALLQSNNPALQALLH